MFLEATESGEHRQHPFSVELEVSSTSSSKGSEVSIQIQQVDFRMVEELHSEARAILSLLNSVF